ncbi:MAG: TonB-dependent receptor [Ignavibacteriales bacterium]
MNSEYTISGKVVDAESSHGVDNVRLTVIGQHIQTFTNESGEFELSGIKKGPYTIEVSLIGYKKKVIANLVVDSSKNDILIKLEAEPVETKAVDIQSSGYGFGSTQLSGFQIEHMASPSDDAMKSISAIPGVISNGYDANFFVRGGLQNELLVELDDHAISSPFHFEQFPFGPVNSLISYRSIEKMDLSLGGFAVNHGDKMSGVLVMYTKDPFKNNYSDELNGSLSAGAGLDFITKQFSLKGFSRLNDDFSIGYILTGRHGNIDLSMKLTGSSFPYDVSYYDTYAKVTLKIKNSHQISISSLYGYDKMREHLQSTTSLINGQEVITTDVNQSEYKNLYNWINWKWIASPRCIINQVLYYDYNPKNISEKYASSSYSLDLNSDDYGYKASSELQLSDSWLISIGSGIQHLNFNKQFESYYRTDNINSAYRIIFDQGDITSEPIENDQLFNSENNIQKGLKSHLFISSRNRISGVISLESGLRLDYNSIIGSLSLSPRALLNWNITPDILIRLSAGLFSQSPDAGSLDLTRNSAKYFLSGKPDYQTSIHYIAGCDLNLDKNLFLKTDIYYKDYTSLEQPFMSETPLINSIYGKAQKGSAMGLEIFLKYFSDDISGWIGYSFASTKVNVNKLNFQTASQIYSMPGGTFYRDIDQHHTISLALDYTWIDQWHLDLQLISNTGRPYTGLSVDENISFIQENGQKIPAVHLKVGGIQNERYNEHVQLDLKLRRKFNLWGSRLDVFIGILNILDYPNYDRKSGTIQVSGSRAILKLSERKGVSATPFLGLYLQY